MALIREKVLAADDVDIAFEDEDDKDVTRQRLLELPEPLQRRMSLRLLNDDAAYKPFVGDDMHKQDLIYKMFSLTAWGKCPPLHDLDDKHPVSVGYSFYYAYQDSTTNLAALSDSFMGEQGPWSTQPPVAKYNRWGYNYQSMRRLLHTLTFKSKNPEHEGKPFLEFFRHASLSSMVPPKVREVCSRLYKHCGDPEILFMMQVEVDYALFYGDIIMNWNRARSHQDFNPGFRIFDIAERVENEDNASWENVENWQTSEKFAKSMKAAEEIQDDERREQVLSAVTRALIAANNKRKKLYKYLVEAPLFMLHMFTPGKAGAAIRVGAKHVVDFRKSVGLPLNGLDQLDHPNPLWQHDKKFQDIVDADPKAGSKLHAVFTLWTLDEQVEGLKVLARMKETPEDVDLMQAFIKGEAVGPLGDLYTRCCYTIAPLPTTCMIVELLFSQVKQNTNLGESDLGVDSRVSYKFNILHKTRDKLRGMIDSWKGNAEEPWKKGSAKVSETKEQVLASVMYLKSSMNKYSKERMKKIGSRRSFVGVRTSGNEVSRLSKRESRTRREL